MIGIAVALISTRMTTIRNIITSGAAQKIKTR